MASFDLPNSGVYCIRNRINGCVYVGSSTRLKTRRSQHFDRLAQGRNESKLLQAAWVEYGPDAFEFSILEYVDSASDLEAREQFWADKLRATEVGYNVNRRVGTGPRGVAKSADHRKKIGDAIRGRTLTEEHRGRISEGRETSSKALQATLALNAKKRKLTDDQVRLVLAMRENDEPMKKIADAIGVSRRVVRAILSGETYGEVTGLS